MGLGRDEKGNEVSFNEDVEDMGVAKIQLLLRKHQVIKDSRDKIMIMKIINCEFSLYLFSKHNQFRLLCYRMVTHVYLERFVLFIIGISTL